MIHVGIAGWDYADWNGTVYPSGVGRHFDRLAYVSRYVDAIEINSTFYRPVVPRVAESWVERTRERGGLRFTAKSHHSFTHERRSPTEGEVERTLEGLAPLREAGRLGALLLQFPQSFHDGPASREHVTELVARLEGWPIVIEVRHASWESPAAASWFERTAAGWCVVDQPRVRGLTARPLPRVTSRVAYLRLHGRNAANWFRPGAGRDARYDYLYSEEELASLAATAREMADSASELFVIQNNHFRGQALVNALQMKHLFGAQLPPAPEDLVAAYPELASQVAIRRTRLF